MKEELLSALRELDPSATGEVNIARDSQGRIRVVGRLTSNRMPVEALMTEAVERIELDEVPIVTVEGQSLRVNCYLDEASIPDSLSPTVLYQGPMPINLVKAEATFKHTNAETSRKIANCIAELEAIVPVVLDAELNVIDGVLRLDIANRMGIHEVPVVVLNVRGDKAKFLRLVLNRSSEFQVWKHDEAGVFTDALPQLQPLLEPLGFFGTRLLPVTYFSKNLIEYEIDEESTAQGQYRQEDGLAHWAASQRERILNDEQTRQDRSFPDPTMPKLFDLPLPGDEEFLATYDPAVELEAFVRDAQEVAFKADRIHRSRDA